MQIPPVRIPFSQADVDFIKGSLDEVLQSGMLTMGKYTPLFEEKFAQFLGVDFAIATSNGTSALELIFQAIDIKGGTAIVPTNTFYATASAVAIAGGRVIFADCMKENLCLDPQEVKRRIRSDTKAVVIVHIGGIISPYTNEIRSICDYHGIPLIEDCAHAHGSSLGGQMAGTFGLAGAFSFFPTKVLVAGEGGAVVTNDEKLANRIKILRNHGKERIDGEIVHTALGNNARISEFNAIVGFQQVSKASEIINQRRAIAEWYDNLLIGLQGVTTLSVTDLNSSYYKYLVMLSADIDRDQLKARLKSTYHITLPSEVYGPRELCHVQPIFRRRSDLFLNAWEEFPNADFVSRHQLALPIYPGLSYQEVEYVVSSLGQALNELT